MPNALALATLVLTTTPCAGPPALLAAHQPPVHATSIAQSPRVLTADPPPPPPIPLTRDTADPLPPLPIPLARSTTDPLPPLPIPLARVPLSWPPSTATTATPSSADAPPGLPSIPLPSPSTSPSRYSWPLAPPHPVLRPFQPPAGPYGPGHRGVDLGAVVGEPVLAAADGVVSFAGWVATRGVVSVTHAGGLRTTYEPIRPEVATGQRVRRGEEVGRLMPGHEGCASGCLHWGVRRGDEYLDPLRLLSTQRVRLLPWREPPPGRAA